MNRYFQEVIDAHELIRQWLGNTQSDSIIYDQLLARFSPDFSMVTPSGIKLNYRSLATFFLSHAGAKPGLSISIENMTLITESPTAATVCYQEWQKLSDHPSSLRFSTVVFERNSHGILFWRHLHETTLPL